MGDSIETRRGAAGVVFNLAVGEAKGARKRPVTEIRLIAGWGVEGDAHAGSGRRQVSLLAWESIQRMSARGVNVGPGDFAENITTSGVDLTALRVGDLLEIGGAELEVSQIGKDCHEPCAIYRAVGDCVMPREGIFAVVRREGVVRVGDRVVLKR